MIRQDWSTLKKLMFAKTAAGGAAAIEDTATGNPVVFVTDLAKALKELKVGFLPVQASGTPSPDNILPITGWDAVNVFHAGKNLLDVTKVLAFTESGYNHYSISDGVVTITGASLFGFKIPVKPSTKYAWRFETTSSVTVEGFDYSEEPSNIKNSDHQFYYRGDQTSDGYFTTPSGCNWVAFAIYTNKSDVTMKDFQIEVGETATAYEPYKTPSVYPATFPSTIYCGYVDMVTGEVWKTWNGINLGSKTYTKRSENQNRQIWEATFNDAQFFGTSSYSAEAKCSQFDLTTSNGAWTVGKFAPAFSGTNQVFIFVFEPNSFANGTECKEAMDGVQLVYKLRSPVLITTLTPQQINAIKGNNTIWSDANDNIEVTYYKKQS